MLALMDTNVFVGSVGLDVGLEAGEFGGELVHGSAEAIGRITVSVNTIEQ